MKTFLLIVGIFAATTASAQGIFCQIDSQYTQPGLYPLPEDLPCLVGDGEFNDFTIQFVMFDSAEVSGFKMRVEYVVIEEILNLPCGIKWCTNKAFADTAHRFNNKELGCIRFYGVTSDVAGQYKLDINVRAKVSLLPGEVPYNAEDLGFRVDVRLKSDSAAVCPAIDTTSGATLLTGSCPTEKDCSLVGGISNIASISNLTLAPNPAHGYTAITFNADKPANYTARIINIYGQEVSNEQLNVVAGTNVEKVDVSSLAAGMYIYMLTDGKNTVTERFLVE